MINKRYKDIFNSFIYKGEKTPFSIGTLVVFALCFILLIVATFTQIPISIPYFVNSEAGLLEFKTLLYNPQICAMILCIYLLKRTYSYFLFALYLIVGIFIAPIFVFGFGLEVFQSYLFGYFLGFGFAIFIAGSIFNLAHTLKARLLGSILGVVSIHLTGIVYCFILALFNVIDFSLLSPIYATVTGSKIFYDITFSILIVLLAPYIKNVFWLCMKPKLERNKSKNIGVRS